MKKLQYITFSILLMGLLACKKDEPAPIDQPIDTDGQTLTLQGTWMGSGSYSASGSAKIYTKDGNRTLAFENFKASNGPDLRVYLAKSLAAGDFIDLGVLKSTSGNFTYSVANNVNLSEHKFVLVWCRQFTVLFGSAELKQP
jgi:hypothetical protein